MLFYALARRGDTVITDNLHLHKSSRKVKQTQSYVEFCKNTNKWKTGIKECFMFRIRFEPVSTVLSKCGSMNSVNLQLPSKLTYNLIGLYSAQNTLQRFGFKKFSCD